MSGQAAFWLAQHVGGRVLDALLATVRFDVRNDAAWRDQVAAGTPVLFTLWHGRLLPLSYLHRHQNIVALISRSTDGEYVARLMQHWGYEPVRGSSSRGGDIAFRELIRVVRKGRSAAITPDGPRGPREQLKPGVLQLAQMTGAAIVPMAGGADRAWWFEGWDRFLVPKPFSRMRVIYGDAVFIPRAADAAALEEATSQIEATLGNLMRQADARA
jgi:lysophospholipid acyltransferase (LPLAT)-like uncharacterized protein